MCNQQSTQKIDLRNITPENYCDLLRIARISAHRFGFWGESEDALQNALADALTYDDIPYLQGWIYVHIKHQAYEQYRDPRNRRMVQFADMHDYEVETLAPASGPEEISTAGQFDELQELADSIERTIDAKPIYRGIPHSQDYAMAKKLLRTFIQSITTDRGPGVDELEEKCVRHYKSRRISPKFQKGMQRTLLLNQLQKQFDCEAWKIKKGFKRLKEATAKCAF